VTCASVTAIRLAAASDSGSLAVPVRGGGWWCSALVLPGRLCGHALRCAWWPRRQEHAGEDSEEEAEHASSGRPLAGARAPLGDWAHPAQTRTGKHDKADFVRD